MTSGFRLSSGKYPGNSGKGAALHGGRWNPTGLEVVYAAASASLAVLEILVHFSVLPRDFVLTEIRIPASVLIEIIDEHGLPTGWDGCSPAAETQEFGRTWVIERRSAVLSVPSVIVPSDRNYVLSPSHPDFGKIQFLPPRPFRFDTRLK